MCRFIVALSVFVFLSGCSDLIRKDEGYYYFTVMIPVVREGGDQRGSGEEVAFIYNSTAELLTIDGLKVKPGVAVDVTRPPYNRLVKENGPLPGFLEEKGLVLGEYENDQRFLFINYKNP